MWKSNQIMNEKHLTQFNKWQALLLFWGKEEQVKWGVLQNIHELLQLQQDE